MKSVAAHHCCSWASHETKSEEDITNFKKGRQDKWNIAWPDSDELVCFTLCVALVYWMWLLLRIIGCPSCLVVGVIIVENMPFFFMFQSM